MQGPINREPDEKLDPSNSKQNPATSGIRRLYVLDSNNFLVVVVDLKLDDIYCSIVNFILNINNSNITDTTSSIDLEINNNNNHFDLGCFNLININTSDCNNNDENSRCMLNVFNEFSYCNECCKSASIHMNSSSSSSEIDDNNENSSISKLSNIYSLHKNRFSLIIFILNVLYLFICNYMNNVFMSIMMVLLSIVFEKIYFLLFLLFFCYVLVNDDVYVRVRKHKKNNINNFSCIK